jgi:hypothetical protein
VVADLAEDGVDQREDEHLEELAPEGTEDAALVTLRRLREDHGARHPVGAPLTAP